MLESSASAWLSPSSIPAQAPWHTRTTAWGAPLTLTLFGQVGHGRLASIVVGRDVRLQQGRFARPHWEPAASPSERANCSRTVELQLAAP